LYMINESIFLIPKKQIVVVKGWEGFADRLQVLSHCIEYCKTTGATICVDWRDYMWGQSKEDFHDYFEIIGIPSIPVNQLLDHIQPLTDSSGNPQLCKIFPLGWTLETVAKEPCELFHFPEFENEINMKLLKIYVDYDVLVHNGKGLRTYHSSNLINNIRFQRVVCDHIKCRLSDLVGGDVRIPYTAIHLRGTDRLSGAVIDDCIIEAANKVYAQYERLDPFEKQRVYIVTDMEEMRSEIMRRIPIAEYLPCPKVATLPKNSKRGRHMLRPDALEFYGIKKRDLILDALADFMILCLSDTIISNQPESLFYKMSELIGKNGGKEGAGSWLSDK